MTCLRTVVVVACAVAAVVAPARPGLAQVPGRLPAVPEARALAASGERLDVPAIVPASFLEVVDSLPSPASAPADGGTRGRPDGAAAADTGAGAAPARGDGAPAAPPPIERLPPPAAAGPGAPVLTPPAEPDLPGSLAIDDRDEPLTLAEVLGSVRRHYPLLQAIERERGIAAGRLTAAMGAFDTNVTMAGNALAPGTYENYLSDFGVGQLLQTGGVQVFGGYRTGFGSFPTYKLAQKTADIGEFRGGVTVPLARDRDIDSARGGRDKARLDQALAEPTIVRSRLDYMRAAALSYWIWLGSGEFEEAAERLEDLAVRRDGELAEKVKRGVVANIERVDNQKNIALRRGLLVQADRAVQQATIDLSLFLRNDAGKPLLPARRRMKVLPEPMKPEPAVYEAALSRALAARPEFARLSLEREKLIVERRLAVNETLPGVDAQLVGNQDAGYAKSQLSGPFGLDRQVLQASLIFQMPAQRREGRGRLQAVDSQLVQLDRRIEFMNDTVRAEVQDAYSKLERAFEFHGQAVQQEELAKLVADAEREQFRLGRSDILRVTLREQAKFDADLVEIAARREFWKADAELRAADTTLDRLGAESSPLGGMTDAMLLRSPDGAGAPGRGLPAGGQPGGACPPVEIRLPAAEPIPAPASPPPVAERLPAPPEPNAPAATATRPAR
jgi:cobalt-zinc-cadmium efflux system outer membrane protein